jgi:hypothetical protein
LTSSTSACSQQLLEVRRGQRLELARGLEGVEQEGAALGAPNIRLQVVVEVLRIAATWHVWQLGSH